MSSAEAHAFWNPADAISYTDQLFELVLPYMHRLGSFQGPARR